MPRAPAFRYAPTHKPQVSPVKKPVARAGWQPGREWETVAAIQGKKFGSMAEKSLFIAIARHTFQRNRHCHAGLPTLASEADCDLKTARGAVRQMKKKKLIHVEARKGFPNSIDIDWKVFEALRPADHFNARGRPRKKPLPKTVGVPLPETAGVTPAENGTRGVKNLRDKEIEGKELSGAISPAVEKAALPLVPHPSPLRKKTPQQERYARVARLAEWAVRLLETDPNMNDGDLAECLKQQAAIHHMPYFDALPNANAPIQQAIVIARERVKVKVGIVSGGR